MSRRRQILVVDDDRSLRKLLVDILESEGYDAHAVGNGREAMNRLAGPELPDLIILDLMLPKMTGWDLRAELQENTRLKAIPVLVVSGVGPDMVAVAAEGHMQKPIDLDDFLTTVDRLCAPPQTERLVH
jgi:CheY-like chemotaxis protein